MQVKLLRDVLVGDSDVTPGRTGSLVEMEEGKAREFIAHGLAVEVEQKAAIAPQNKAQAAPQNKARKATTGSKD